MKYRTLGAVMTVVMLLSISAISFYTPENPKQRVHQHLTARGPDAGCNCGGTELCTHLPLVIIDTGGQTIPGEVTGETDAYGETINTLAEAHIAQTDTTALLTQHPEINVLLAFNEPTSVGAAKAIETRDDADEIFLVGFDSNVSTVDGLQNGTVDALIVQNPYAMGYLGVESAYKLLTGQTKDVTHTVDTSTQIVDRDNLFSMDSQKALFTFEQRGKSS